MIPTITACILILSGAVLGTLYAAQKSKEAQGVPVCRTNWIANVALVALANLCLIISLF